MFLICKRTAIIIVVVVVDDYWAAASTVTLILVFVSEATTGALLFLELDRELDGSSPSILYEQSDSEVARWGIQGSGVSHLGMTSN